MTFLSSTRNLTLLASLLASSSQVACSKCSGRDDKARLAALQLDQAPAIEKPMTVAFGDQVTLLGYKLESPEALHAKDRVKITFYWRLEKDLPAGWRLASRVVGERGEVLLNADDIGPLRERRNRKQVLSPSEWAVGKVYVDEQVLRLPSKLSGNFIKILAAFRKGDESLKPATGEVDKRGYLTVVQIPVDIRRKARQVPQYALPRLESTSKLEIDGVADEPAWSKALAFSNLTDLRTGRSTPSESGISANAKVMWDEAALYLAVDVADSDLTGGFKKSAVEPPVWKRDSLEIVLKTKDSADNKDYYRIGVGIQGLIFDAAYDDFGLPAGAAGAIPGNLAFKSDVQVGVKLKGTLDEPTDEDTGYTMEVRIPWSALGGKEPFAAANDKSFWMNFAVYSAGEVRGLVPYFGDQSLQVARCFGKFVFTPADKPMVEPVFIQPLTGDLPESLVQKQAALAAKIAAESAAANAQKGAASAASAPNLGAEGAAPPPAAGH